jgi:PAS domain S-box-containing protein
MEEPHQEGEIDYWSVLQSVPNALVVINSNGRIVCVNTQAETMFGYCREEMLYQPVELLIPHRFCTALHTYRHHCVSVLHTRPQPPSLEGYGRRKGGSEFPLDLILSPLGTAGSVLVTGIIHRVTGHKEMDETQALLIELCYEPIFVWGLAEGIVMWNQGCEQLYGFAKTEAIGRSSHTLLQTIFPVAFAQYLTSLSHDRRWSGELRHTTRDGREVIVESRHQLIEVDGRQLVLETNRDITLRKQAEETQRQLLARLVTAQEEERQHISYALHDQMGQHLSVLLLGLEAVEADVQVLPTTRQRVRQLRALTDRLGQEVHRLAWTLRPSDLEHGGLETVLENYVDEWSQLCGIAVDFHSRGGAPWHLPPHTETTLYRIVQEALTNVLKHAHATSVSVLLEQRPDHVLLIVEDNGTGFDIETVLGVRREQGRLGVLGMQERVGLLGGTLEIESTPGAGTTMFVRIPTPVDDPCTRS